jgi:hypothetical protein
MITQTLPARFESFALPGNTGIEATVAIPGVKGNWKLKYGKHAYYFMNFQTSEGICVTLRHSDIIPLGLDQVRKAIPSNGKTPSSLRSLCRRYHYGFNSLEQIMFMTVPHNIPSIGGGRYIVSLLSYGGYLVVDCRSKAVTYHTIDGMPKDHVLGSQQWFDSNSEELYTTSYSLNDSFSRIADPYFPVSGRIFKHKMGSATSETIWSGDMADYLHDILVNKTRQYCVVCEFGMCRNGLGEIVPSKVKIVDLLNKKEWTIDKFIVAAHAQFDPDDPNVIYFSNHNFQFEHSNIFKLMKKATYAVNFRGPASVHKYRLTPEGPREIGVFTQPDFYRLTNMHIFEHRGRKVIASMGFPDEVFLIDADEMTFIRKIRVKDPCSLRHLYSRKPAFIGTISQSPNGEKLFVQTTKSFQVIDLDSGNVDFVRDYFHNHSYANHMLTSTDTSW